MGLYVDTDTKSAMSQRKMMMNIPNSIKKKKKKNIKQSSTTMLEYAND